MSAPTAAQLLRAAAEGYRTGAIRYGREWFAADRGSCRCVSGAIAWAACPGDLMGDPLHLPTAAEDVQRAANDAVAALSYYLISELDAYACTWNRRHDTEDRWVPVPDPVETIAGWNDETGRTVDEVVAALTATADRLERVRR